MECHAPYRAKAGRRSGQSDQSAASEEFIERGAIANINGEMGEVLCGGFEAIEIPKRVSCCAKKFAAHIVVNADDPIALAVELLDSFRANEPATPSDENHFPIIRGAELPIVIVEG